ncbi:MAG: NADP-dependent malic enzyme [Proteobacteria bacterium]|nr:NADP-dependent malic enzyme [Pseudomonadota bacterium]
MTDNLREAALAYHRYPKPGKLEVTATKPLANQHDLALAYSPGVAAACDAIVEDPAEASNLTARANLVAVITNGTAVLGLGAIGPLAAKPVMEGKAVLFKKFAGIDVFDIELDERDPDKLVDIVAALEPTFGAINLEDIKAPECFEIEGRLRERMSIPVFHDDQHGTAIIVGAAITNGLRLVGKDLGAIKLVTSGAGAAALACLDLLLSLGVKRENIWATDIAGVVYEGRVEEMDPWKARYAQKTDARKLAEVIEGADVFLGLSAPGVLEPEMVARMADKPIILALANPVPEIMPEAALAARPDAIIATGRSDYPNQVNNVLCFPFIFRGALDVGATTINEAMKIACVTALAELARETSSAEVASVYRGERIVFGREYLIPKPFDLRLLGQVASSVARVAMETGVARRPLADLEAYRARLDSSVFRSAMLMKPVFEAARSGSRKIVFAEGEDERVLRTAQSMLQEGIDRPVLIGRPEVIAHRIERAGLTVAPGEDFEVCDPTDDPRYREYWETYHRRLERKGITPELARTIMRTNTTAIAAVMVHRGDADAMICGTFGQYLWHLKYVSQMLEGLPDGSGGELSPIGALSPVILDQGVIFIGDTQLNHAPSAEQIAETAIAAARHIRRFGIEPKVALLSHSVFGSLESDSARRVRRALEILDAGGADFEYEGEMHADHALDPELRQRIFPNSRLEGAANCLIFANVDAASGSRNILKQLANGLEVGPILMGMGNKAHIVSPSVTARGLLNIAALAGTPVQHYA